MGGQLISSHCMNFINNLGENPQKICLLNLKSYLLDRSTLHIVPQIPKSLEPLTRICLFLIAGKQRLCQDLPMSTVLRPKPSCQLGAFGRVFTPSALAIFGIIFFPLVDKAASKCPQAWPPLPGSGGSGWCLGPSLKRSSRTRKTNRRRVCEIDSPRLALFSYQPNDQERCLGRSQDQASRDGGGNLGAQGRHESSARAGRVSDRCRRPATPSLSSSWRENPSPAARHLVHD